MLAFVISNRKDATKILSAGYRILAIGYDEFNFNRLCGATLAFSGGKLVLGKLEENLGRFHDRNDLFLIRHSSRPS